ncbi:hypothetical protein [Natronorubrum sp. DTA28]|uniref:hypothetical protein n=1 Tax=Natronorubrum sp. DTA28 TaxID=3447019 RepID=UPI003F87D480
MNHNKQFAEGGLILVVGVALLAYGLATNDTNTAAAAGIVTGATIMLLAIVYGLHRRSNEVDGQ